MLELEGVDEQPDIDDQESTTDSVYIEIQKGDGITCVGMLRERMGPPY